MNVLKEPLALMFFSKDLEPIGVIGDPMCVIWTDRHREAGEFEIHVPLTEKNKALCTEDNIVWIKGEQQAGIIDYVNKVHDDSIAKLQVKGKSQQSVLGWRILWGTNVMFGTVTDVMRRAIQFHALYPVQHPQDRNIPFLRLYSPQTQYGQTIRVQRTGTNLQKFVEDMCDTYGLGYRMVFDYKSKTVSFRVVQGADKTIGNAQGNRACIFSSAFDTLMRTSYVMNAQSKKTFALIAGEGEGEDRKKAEVGGGSGADRREIYVDAKDLRSQDDEGNEIPLSEYMEMLEQRGESVLSENAVFESIGGEINVDGNLKYGIDYELGDIVTIVDDDMGLYMDVPILEVTRTWSEGAKTLSVQFGQTPPTVMKQLRKQVN